MAHYTNRGKKLSMALNKEIPVRTERQEKVGAFLIREKRRSDMEAAIGRGLHFHDAAEIAGIPYEVAISAVNNDEEFRVWYEISKGRPRLDNKPTKKYNPKTSLQIKSDFVNKLNDVGLFDKIAVMADQADPETEEGKQILGFFMRYIVKDILPKETAAKVEHTEKASYDTLTDAELLEALHKRREERIEYTREIKDADQKRLSHTEEYIEEIREYKEEDGTDTGTVT